MSDTNWETVQVPFGFNPGQIVVHGTTRGRITVVTNYAFSVVWDDGDGDAVVYPLPGPETIRIAMPWES